MQLYFQKKLTDAAHLRAVLGYDSNIALFITVRPWDTGLQAARTSQVHVFELGPKIFEMNEFM